MIALMKAAGVMASWSSDENVTVTEVADPDTDLSPDILTVNP
jgi:hypothetical protein